MLLAILIPVLLIDAHVPTATVSGDVVTVSADFAFLDIDPLEVVQGVPLYDTSLLASTDGALPVSWRLAPGTYQITAFGYPDKRSAPNRNRVVLTVTIDNPTRQQQIKDAIQRFSIANIEAQHARDEIRALQPTRAEISAALSTQAGP